MCCCWLAEHPQRVHQRFLGIKNNRSLVTHEVDGPGIIFRGTGKRISQVEKAAWHPGVEVEFQGCARAGIDYCNRWIDKTFKAAVTEASGVNPAEQPILFAGNM